MAGDLRRGSALESRAHGAPMLVLPAWTDQCGDAARVAFHNAGVQGDITGVTPEKLTAMVERLLTDESIPVASSAMRAQCDAKQEMDGLLRFVAHHTGVSLARASA